jgi:hypothetical protein
MAQRPATVDRLVACQQHQNTGSFQVVGRQAVGVLHRFRLHGSGGGNDGGHSRSVVHADPVATPPGLVAEEESHVSAARHTPGHQATSSPEVRAAARALHLARLRAARAQRRVEATQAAVRQASALLIAATVGTLAILAFAALL